MENHTNCIFLIDEDAIANTINTLTLKELPFCKEILAFTDSDEALDYLNNHTSSEFPQVIFLDYNSPFSSALEITKHLKKISSNIKAVILTAHINNAKTKELMKDSFVDDLIIKPLTPDKVFESFRKMNLI